MTVQDVIDRFRLYLIEFGVTTMFVDDTDLFGHIQDIERTTLREIVGVGNASYPLPGDACIRANVAATLGPYALTATFWQLRHMILEYADGSERRVHMLTPQHGQIMPVLVPAAYLHQNAVYPVAGEPATAADRRWGWEDASFIHVHHVTLPAQVVDGTTVLSAPDDARAAIAAQLAVLIVPRAKVESDIMVTFAKKANEERARLLQHVAEYSHAG